MADNDIDIVSCKIPAHLNKALNAECTKLGLTKSDMIRSLLESRLFPSDHGTKQERLDSELIDFLENYKGPHTGTWSCTYGTWGAHSGLIFLSNGSMGGPEKTFRKAVAEFKARHGKAEHLNRDTVPEPAKKETVPKTAVVKKISSGKLAKHWERFSKELLSGLERVCPEGGRLFVHPLVSKSEPREGKPIKRIKVRVRTIGPDGAEDRHIVAAAVHTVDGYRLSDANYSRVTAFVRNVTEKV